MDYREAAARVDAVRVDGDPLASAAAMSALFNAEPDTYDAFSIGEVGNPITVRTAVDGQAMADAMLAAVPQRQQKYVDNIQRPRANPQAAAVAAAPKWSAGVQAAIQRNAYANGVRGYNLDEAIATAIADGGAGWAAGIAKRAPKIRRAMDIVARDVTAAMQAVRQMPQSTIQERTARSSAFQMAMYNAKQQRTGGGSTAAAR